MSPRKWMLLAVFVGGCGPTTTVAAPTSVPGSTSAGGSASASVAAAPSSTAAASGAAAQNVVLEDAGINVELKPGVYTSRVFRPTIEFRLDGGWQRRDATRDAALAIVAADMRWVVTIRQLDFAQCGKTLLQHPRADAASKLIGAASKLTPRPAGAVQLGDRAGVAIDLPGTGSGVGDAIDPANGCVLSQGNAPWPAESLWAVLNPDTSAHVVLVDVGTKTLTLIGRSSAADLPAASKAMDAVLSTMRFPEDAAAS